jgi:hypothetical protein
MDNDGDTDLIVGEYDPRIRLYSNMGSETSPVLANFTYLLNPVFGGSDDIMTPTVVDWDGDGLLDIVVGSDDYGVRAHWNVGTPTTPAFSTSSFQQLIPGTDNGRYSPTPVDWDGDGDLDLLVGSGDDSPATNSGKVFFFRNTGGTLTNQGALKDTAGTDIDVGTYSKPFVCDWNNDGWLDLLVGNSTGNVWLYLGFPDPLPKSPESFSAEAVGGDVVLTWDPVTENLWGVPITVGFYRVYGGTDAYFPVDGPHLIGTSATTDYTDAGAAGDPGVNHFYRVTAVSGFYESFPSDCVGEFDFASP